MSSEVKHTEVQLLMTYLSINFYLKEMILLSYHLFFNPVSN